MSISSENQFKRTLRGICDDLEYGTPSQEGSVLRQLDHGQPVVLSDQIAVLRATEIVRIGIGNLHGLGPGDLESCGFRKGHSRLLVGRKEEAFSVDH